MQINGPKTTLFNYNSFKTLNYNGFKLFIFLFSVNNNNIHMLLGIIFRIISVMSFLYFPPIVFSSPNTNAPLHQN